jgi:LEA14-like dessication related protein
MMHTTTRNAASVLAVAGALAGLFAISSCATRPAPAEVEARTPVVQDPPAPLVVGEPTFRITSIKIERDLLVTTSLRIDLEIENPNDFPLEFRSLAYDFYGEGKLWSDGSFEGPVSIPAGGKARLGLRFEMSFADMDRRLFDLVANLKVVRYRITGEAIVAAGNGLVPDFAARFDEEGSCAVAR